MASSSVRAIKVIQNILLAFRKKSKPSNDAPLDRLNDSNIVAPKAVKPHYPLIKFRKSGARSDQVLAGQTPPTATATATKATSASAPPSSKPIGSTARGTGIDESQLPARYARKPLSQYEGDYIQRGGPE
ncbi:28S ribosomal protein S36, mitochondrial isoform X1 [Ixodes scapularis]|uniref:28S ribosomal protein S36, mitochondrial isoform X1 n=1 Tax=Ixodes scapularis TaxID=6945 RepID=UPI001A9F8CDC|nr:28S ribosomal protein S36, mitochondrial isoform X1 [Ixodes scapularis]